MNDYFLSHASEDKELVRAVYFSLNKKGYSCWFDEAEILPGDSLVEKVFRDGLKSSRFIILFISKNFLKKEWPQIELETMVAKQIRENKKIIIPFLIDISHHELVEQYPFFESIYCGNASSGLEIMIKQLENLLKRQPNVNSAEHVNKNEMHSKQTLNETEVLDFKKFIKLPAIYEINRLSETFLVVYHRAPSDLRIDIIEFAEGSYYGVCNYSYWGPEQATPYKSMRPQSTVVDALNDAINGIDAFDSADYPNELVFWVSDSDVVIDGNGGIISKEEAYSRRSKKSSSYQMINWTQTLMNGGPWWLVSKNYSIMEFSVIGPIDDDTEYIYKCVKFQEAGIDFRLETVPVSKQTKEYLEVYYSEKHSLKLVDNKKLYNQ